MRKKTLIGALAVVGVASVAASVLAPAPVPVTTTPQPQAQVAHTASNPVFVSLPVRQAMGRSHSNLFTSPPPPKPVPVVVSPPPATPLPPPMPYRVVGQIVHDGTAEVVLAKGDRLITVHEGDRLDGTYKIESISQNGVTLVYMPLDVRQTLSTGTTRLAGRPAEARPSVAAGPAQLRWDGPHQVRAGDTFHVALRVTSADPIGASPLQLSFDSKLLEPVAVRAGGFFADGTFRYRISRDGSIFIAASARETAADDAEFVVVTFRPIRAGTAQLAVSSVELQGASGDRVAHAEPAMYRTAIVQ